MQGLFHSRRILLALAAIVLVAFCVVFCMVPDERQGHLVDQAQQEMVAKVQEAHLLGGTKQNALAFFRRQKMPCQMQYGLLDGDGWEMFLSSSIAPTTLGMTLGGSTGVIAHTTGFLGCIKTWSVETRVLFDGKGKVIGVEVRPAYYGCDV